MNQQPPPPPPPPPHPPPHEPRIDYENGGLDPEKFGGQPLLVMNIINTVTQLVLGAVTMFGIILANQLGTANPRSSLRQHIYLCTIGYMLLMSQAVLTLNPFNGWSQTLKRQHKRTIHWVMQIVGSILAIAGSIVRINAVDANFETAHGIVGLIAMLLTLLSLLGGVINLFCCHDYKVMKVFHACSGILTLSMAYVALILGFQNRIVIIFIGETNAYMGVFFAVVGFIGITISAFSNIFRRIRS